ncbi:MAG: macro domain-containing protein [Planctomycetota bacterium]|nr:macro domain-containing protein [Planctomycetota bacterium]MDA1214990.1 macro domain-containing protein [Planctomycetota bacterium]
MRVQFGSCYVELALGDITRQSVDAIVNAANSQLAGGGGVDGAIHAAAGPTLMQETIERYPDGCPTGQAVATSAGRLNVKHVFHAVGPVWKGGLKGESELLRSAILASLQLAKDHHCKNIAFPAISTGVYGYPIDLAADTSLLAVRDFIFEHHTPELVRFVLFSEGAYGAFSQRLEQLIV